MIPVRVFDSNISSSLLQMKTTLSQTTSRVEARKWVCSPCSITPRNRYYHNETKKPSETSIRNLLPSFSSENDFVLTYLICDSRELTPRGECVVDDSIARSVFFFLEGSRGVERGSAPVNTVMYPASPFHTNALTTTASLKPSDRKHSIDHLSTSRLTPPEMT